MTVPAPSIDGAATPDLPDATPFRPEADAGAELSGALARAAGSGRRVLAILGGNWCGDCRALSGILARANEFIDRHFEIVWIDVGRYDANLDLARRFGIEPKAAPTILVLAADGSRLNGDDLTVLRSARAMTPQAILDQLARWAA